VPFLLSIFNRMILNWLVCLDFKRNLFNMFIHSQFVFHNFTTYIILFSSRYAFRNILHRLVEQEIL